MNVKAWAADTGLTVKAVRFLEKRGLLSDPPSTEQVDFMHSLAQIWRSEEFIKLQVSRMSLPRRARVLFSAGYSEPETFIITRLLFHYSDREDETINLNLEGVVDEVMAHFGIPKKGKTKLLASAKRIRKRICDMRYRSVELKEISRILTGLKTPTRTKTNKAARSTFDQTRQNELFGYN